MEFYKKIIRICLFIPAILVLNSAILMAQDIDCEDCHDPLSKSSVHYDAVECYECHTDIKDEDHEDQRIKNVNCMACHDEEAVSMTEDIHHRLKAEVKDPPTCKFCHGTHNISSPDNVKDKFSTYCSKCHDGHRLNYTYAYHSPVVRNEECLDCHDDEEEYREQLSHSKHYELNCADCHNYIAHNIDEHQDTLSVIHRADCFVCHNDVNQEHSESIHGLSLLAGHDEAAKCWDCHNNHNVVAVADTSSPVNLKNIQFTCGKCHDDVVLMEQFGFSTQCPEKQYNQSVHAKVVAEGGNGPSCLTCHGSHDIKNRVMPDSKTNPTNIPNTCGQCHEEITKEYKNSIHWFRAVKGVRYAPICNDCHCEHGIDAVNSQEHDLASFQQETCIKCHQSDVLVERTNMAGSEANEYLDSYHGLAARRGDPDAAYCVDCHGVHSILPKIHPESTINEKNVVETCGSCHEDATETFANSYSHVSANATARTIETVVENIYIWLIVFVIGGMVLHNLLIFIRESSAKRRATQNALSVTRFTGNEKIQHMFLLLSFIILAITGFALKFPDSFWVVFLKDIGMTEEIRQNIHRVSAVVMIILSFYHLFYLISSRRGRFQLIQLIPTFKDVKDAIINIKYYLRLSHEKPEFTYYDYAEKAEYWALIWGTIVMGVTGLILWFPTFLGDNAPVWVIKVSEIVHYYEAILASLAILVWHWFFVMFRPSEYPMNYTWLDGDTSLEHFKHHHYYEFKHSVLDIYEMVESDRKEVEVSHVAGLILDKLEEDEINPAEFLEGEFARDPELKTWVMENAEVKNM